MNNIYEFVNAVFNSETGQQKKDKGEKILKPSQDDDWKKLSKADGDAANMFYQKYVDSGKIRYKGHLAEPNRPFKEVYYFAFLDIKTKQSIKSGVYVVYLLSADHKTIYFCLAIGVSASSGDEKAINEKVVSLRKLVKSTYFLTEFPKGEEIGKSENAKAYLASIAYYKKYTIDDCPNNEILEQDFNEMMKLYEECLNNGVAQVDESVNGINEKGNKEVTNKDVLVQIENYIKAKGFVYSDKLIENFYLSLRAKPFVILAGTSGTGKTKLVEMFAEAIGANPENGRFLLVPVRPDWSDSTDLLGHMNLSGEFVPGAIADFVLRANKDFSNPYFLCLDEMNLARVEYYLSDILSIIETRKIRDNGRISSLSLFTKNSFNDDTIIVGTDELAKSKYSDLYLSDNLYIIGTVNMDETTFPFSKKVLDRANTIEFSKVDTLIPDFDKIFKAKQDCIGEPTDIGNEFLKAKYTKIEECSEMKDIVVKYCNEIQALNLILEKAESHVGFRVRDEIVFYLLYNREINGDDEKSTNNAFDNEIMQKILPRIQGSGMEIIKLIEELIDFCGNKYTRSKAKLEAMKARCGEYGEGYTSYWL